MNMWLRGLIATLILAACLARPALADDAFDTQMRAAQSGSAAAQANLAYAYAKGLGVAADNRQAVHWYQKSADQGYLPAYSRLAGILYLGEGGVDRDIPRVLALVQYGVAHHDADCLFLMGAFNAEGDILPIDYARAAAYYQAAADKDHPYALGNLADLYENGQGVPRDTEKARQLREQAAALGNETAAAWLQHHPR